MILSLNGRRYAACAGLALCLALLAGCERNQPGPGPKPISGNGAPTPAASGASGAQGTPR
ncbi:MULTISPECIES: hypothetical protein [unclassified Cupriavidus]|uniref:hypothetical protein n=1 Tax=unclassified Cupriavidus TaxID=2640874 RepID=UPI0028B65BAD|nr:hypothetical protein [Cupriavidus sp. SZY C1]MDT6963891.1 hypothetical protein [Cupriavidus sp. SZY C1]